MFMIIVKNSDLCADPQTRLDLVLADSSHVGVIHCCYLGSELTDIISINDLYAMDKESFIQYVEYSYHSTPTHHNYSISSRCKALSKNACVYGKKKLTTIGIGTSRHCNLYCPMCFQKDKKDLSIEEDKKLYLHLLNLLKGNKQYGIRLTGYGEPFFYKKEVFEFLKSLTLEDATHVEAISNITLLNDDDIEELRKIRNKIPFYLSVSCSAITAETYEKVHSKNYFDKVVHNIKQLYNYGILTGINFVVQEENLHELEFYQDFWKSNGLSPDRVTLDVNIKAQSYNKILNSVEYQNYRNSHSIYVNDTKNGKVTV